MQISLALILFTFAALERNVVVSYKVLGIFHTIYPSHHHVGRALLKGLAADGHDVTIVSPFKEKLPITNYSEVHLDGILSDSMKDGNFDMDFR